VHITSHTFPYHGSFPEFICTKTVLHSAAHQNHDAWKKKDCITACALHRPSCTGNPWVSSMVPMTSEKEIMQMSCKGGGWCM